MTNDSFHHDSYDAEGNILTVDSGTTATYVYDALNHRVWSNNTGSPYEYIYDPGGQRVSSWVEPSNIANEGRIYWDGQQIAYRSSDGTTYFDHQDYLGTERVRTNSAGATAATFTSLPWGDGYSANIIDPAAAQDTLQFAGLDADVNNSGALMSEHAQFRNYSFHQGRWLAPDPYDGSYDLTNPQSINRYTYVLNNPLSFTDPLGLWATNLVQCGTDDDGNPVYCMSIGSGPCYNSDVCVNNNYYQGGYVWYCGEYGGCFAGEDGNGVGGTQYIPPPAKLATLSASSKGLPTNCGQILTSAAPTVLLDAAGTVLGAIPGTGFGLVTAQVTVGLAGAANSAFHGDILGTFAGTIG